MKFRTDFVTNSSSSNFCVEVSLQTVDGDEYSATIQPDDGGGDGSADIRCTAEELMNSADVDSLLTLLNDSVEIEFDEDEEEYMPDPEDFLQEMKLFDKAVRTDIHEINQIQSVRLRRIWFAYGECSSSFPSNLGIYADGLLPLAEKVCNSTGDELDFAKIELAKYLNDFSGTIYRFPSGFMESKTNGSIEWRNVSEDIEEFAKIIVSGKLRELSSADYSVETVTIDMQNKTIDQTAKYYLGYDGVNGVKEYSEPVDYTALTSVEAVKKYQAYREAQKNKSDLDRENQLQKLKTLKAGDSFFFGVYPQKRRSKAEPIEWIVLKRDGTKILALSKYTLEKQQFHDNNKPMFWSDSMIREWLNNTFYNEKVFINKESARIIPTTITETDRNGKEFTTVDKIFLLSEEEAKQFFPTPESRIAEGTEVSHAYFGDWGLRSYNNSGLGACGIQFCSGKGRILTKRKDPFNGYQDCDMGVRPVMWIETE